MASLRRLQAGCITATLFGLARAALVSRAAALPAAVQMMALPGDDQVISLQIGLKMQNIELLEEKLKAVSEPSSPDYGKYLSAAEVNELFKPAEKSVATVEAWLEAAGVKDIAREGSFINFATSIATANTLLESSFAYYDVAGTSKLRTLEYSLPDDLLEHIELVTPTTYFGKTKAQAPITDVPPMELLETRQTTPNCARLITPPCLADLYSYGNYTPDPASGSRVGFGSFLNQSARQEDLTKYLTTFNLPLVNFTTVTINGGHDHQDPRGSIGEANLDAQFMSAAMKTLPLTQFITGGRPPFVPNLRMQNEAANTNEPYLEYYQFLLTKENKDIPQVISHSYGDDEQTVPREYAIRVCNLIGLMGLRGVTILESSGDSGVGAPCRANDGSDRVEFTPQFPGSCPYLTTIGGTQGYAPEVAWVASSGGFSNYFVQPWYQKESVATYLEKFISPETKAYYEPFANFSGRGYPDISAHSLSPAYQFINAGATGYTGGTSAAAPLIGGILGLLNDARLRAGQPTMGFINPWLYSRGFKTLIDVTGGSAQGCAGVDLQSGRPVAGAGIVPWATWNATEGWDPATGLGMPNFEEMRKLAIGEA